MQILIALCVLSLSFTTAVTETNRQTSVNGNLRIAADCLNRRMKRSGTILYPAVLTSLDAIKLLTRGAKQLGTQKPYLLFEKIGNYQKAVKDFNSVSPTDLKLFPQPGGHYGATGRIGDTQITVRPRKTDGKPTVEIRRLRGDTGLGKLSYKINYIDE